METVIAAARSSDTIFFAFM
jgi:hypothetical protein